MVCGHRFRNSLEGGTHAGGHVCLFLSKSPSSRTSSPEPVNGPARYGPVPPGPAASRRGSTESGRSVCPSAARSHSESRTPSHTLSHPPAVRSQTGYIGQPYLKHNTNSVIRCPLLSLLPRKTTSTRFFFLLIKKKRFYCLSYRVIFFKYQKLINPTMNIYLQRKLG